MTPLSGDGRHFQPLPTIVLFSDADSELAGLNSSDNERTSEKGPQPLYTSYDTVIQGSTSTTTVTSDTPSIARALHLSGYDDMPPTLTSSAPNPIDNLYLMHNTYFM